LKPSTISGSTRPSHDDRLVVERLVDKVVGRRGLLGDSVDGMLEDLALSACHGRIVDVLGVTPIAAETPRATRAGCRSHAERSPQGT
jgi:hypothetical protein